MGDGMIYEKLGDLVAATIEEWGSEAMEAHVAQFWLEVVKTKALIDIADNLNEIRKQLQAMNHDV